MDARTDLFSLGVVLYENIRGARRSAANAVEVMGAILHRSRSRSGHIWRITPRGGGE